jgi:peptidoglycan-N-acetylglucosamine deacetylase
MFYAVKTPWWLKKLYRRCIWHLPTGGEKVLYLSFDDGPHPSITPFVLDQLAQYGAKASFFCIGKNVVAHGDMYRRILAEGHQVGNHTYQHLNGWKTPDSGYLADVASAAEHIPSPLFRPPYGRIRFSQIKQLQAYRIIMWSVLSGDFDPAISPEKCLRNVTRHASSGDIVVFHDSEKAFERLRVALPGVLQYFSEKGFVFKAIPV